MDITDYINHVNKILHGLESLQALEDAGLTQLTFEGLQVYDHEREQPCVVSTREMLHTFQREFRDAMTAKDKGVREIE